MDNTIFLAQFWGWLLIIFCSIFLLRRKALFEEIFELSSDKGFTVLSGYIALVLGLVSILFHNVWSGDWRVLITIIGWISLVKGILRIGFPKFVEKTVAIFRTKVGLMQTMLVAMFIIGAWLIYSSWDYAFNLRSMISGF